MAQAIIGSVQTTDPWGAYDQNAVERDPSVYPRQIDESTRQQTVVNYTPTTVAAPGSIWEDMMRQAFERSQQTPAPPQPQGPTPYWENPETYYPQQQRGPDPVAQAKAATAAAYKYIAFRGYQQDLKEGKSAADAFAKWGPMLVQDVSLAPALNAYRGAPSFKFNTQTQAYEPSGGAPSSSARPYFKPNPTAAPTSVRMVDEIQKTEGLLRKAVATGDKEAEQFLKDRAEMLREQLKGQETVMGWDDQNRPIMRTGKGVGSATVATQSQAQQKLLKYENAMEIMARLDNVLKPEHVGVRGVGGEWIVDKGLQQLAEMAGSPDVGSEGRIESRKLIVALREGLMRELSDDNRFSLADREEISKALPSNGAFESYMDAKKAMNTVRKIIVQRSKNYSKAIGSEDPIWTLSPEEIKAKYKAGKMTLDEAKNALTRFH